METRHLVVIGTAFLFVSLIVLAIEIWLKRVRDAILALGAEVAQLRQQLAVQAANTGQLYRAAVEPRPLPVIDETVVLSPGEQHRLRQRQLAPRAP